MVPKRWYKMVTSSMPGSPHTQTPPATQGRNDPKSTRFGYRCGKLRRGEPQHATLDDGILDAEHFGNACLEHLRLPHEYPLKIILTAQTQNLHYTLRAGKSAAEKGRPKAGVAWLAYL